MKKHTFLISIIITNLTFILILLHKRNAITELIYTKQRHEHELLMLTKKADALQHELCKLQDRTTVKTYAQTYLHMSPMTLAQMKKITS